MSSSGTSGKEPACQCKRFKSPLSQGDPLEGRLVTHPSITHRLEKPPSRGVLQTTLHRIAKSQTRLKRLNTHTSP